MCALSLMLRGQRHTWLLLTWLSGAQPAPAAHPAPAAPQPAPADNGGWAAFESAAAPAPSVSSAPAPHDDHWDAFQACHGTLRLPSLARAKTSCRGRQPGYAWWHSASSAGSASACALVSSF